MRRSPQVEQMTEPLVMAAANWNRNSDMILDLVRLGYLRKEWKTLDPTYGRGNWWKKWRPDLLHASDLEPTEDWVVKADFTELTDTPSDFYDVVTFDPPYIAQGGRTTSTTHDFMDRYGLVDVPPTTDSNTQLIVAGLSAIQRVTVPGGLILLKCMNYVNGGRYRTAAYDALAGARGLGLTLVDEFIHLRRPGPQPKRARQLHARRNYSLLFVLQKGK